MKKTLVPLLAFLALSLFAVPASAQYYPEPVDLGIKNEEQKIEEWFWPALARQVLLKQNPQTPTQCQLASLANDLRDGTERPNCCQDPIPEGCKRPLNHQALLTFFELSNVQAEVVPRPKTAEEIYEYLKNGQPILVGFLIAEDKRHAYLVRGLSWEEDGRPMLLINDPHVTEPFKAPFAEEVPGWRTVIVIKSAPDWGQALPTDVRTETVHPGAGANSN